jgi:hypothetical protein
MTEEMEEERYSGALRQNPKCSLRPNASLASARMLSVLYDRCLDPLSLHPLLI